MFAVVGNIILALLGLPTLRFVSGEGIEIQRDGNLVRASLLRREAAELSLKQWNAISRNSSCEETWYRRRREENRLEPACRGVSRTLVECQGCCESTPRCVSIDWYATTSSCLMYVEACTASEATRTGDGASSWRLSSPCPHQSTKLLIDTRMDRQTALATLNNCVVGDLSLMYPVFQIDEPLLQPVTKQCKLRSLTLSGAIIKYSAASEIATNCPQMSALVARHMPGDPSAGLAKMIETLPRLSHIEIGGKALTESLYPTLMKVGGKLTQLVLRNPSFNDAAAIALLGRCRHLVRFDIYNCRSVHDAVFIAAAERFPDIRYIGAENTGLTDAGAQAVMSKCKSLKRFHIGRTDVAPATRNELLKKGVMVQD
eukprot:TRINITY_DN16627_c0_g1_i9.p1 TRINITY_DN16627_c0_g1~~TRINITY_DN16627_c0_g1_i9.p1  ORF type:complete len:390 (+),score=10.90 TRINITY_DN16627_c0_g1_i9:55-1170(+)